MSKDNLIIQQRIIQSIKSELKEIKQLIKNAKKDVKKTGTNDDIMKMKLVFKDFEKNISYVERELFKLKFKSATSESVTAMKEWYRMIKENKQLLVDNYPHV